MPAVKVAARDGQQRSCRAPFKEHEQSTQGELSSTGRVPLPGVALCVGCSSGVCGVNHGIMGWICFSNYNSLEPRTQLRAKRPVFFKSV